jgi:hypothetical protein
MYIAKLLSRSLFDVESVRRQAIRHLGAEMREATLIDKHLKEAEEVPQVSPQYDLEIRLRTHSCIFKAQPTLRINPSTSSTSQRNNDRERSDPEVSPLPEDWSDSGGVLYRSSCSRTDRH